MQNEALTEEPVDIKVFLAVLRRRKWLILLVTALLLGLVFAYTLRQTPIYSATAVVEVKPVNSQQAYAGLPAFNFVSMETEAAKIRSQEVAKDAAKSLGIAVHQTDELNGLLGPVSVEAIGGTTLLKITYSDPDPAVAQQRAAAFADAYIAARKEYVKQVYEDARKGPEQNLRDANKVVGSLEAQLLHTPRPEQIGVLTPKLAALESRITFARSTAQSAQLTLLAVPTPNPEPSSLALPAALPTSPSSPNIKLNAVLGLILGLGLGVGSAFLRERMDNRLSGREEFEEATGVPALAVVPKVQDWKKRDKTELITLVKPKSQSAEAYRTMRTNLQYIARRDDVRMVELTSSTLGEGKTTTTANLGVALAQTGKRVIIISCDLRKPRLHRFFGLENKVGISSLVAGNATLAEATQRVPGLDSLRLIASGPVPPNPAEMLGSEQIQRLLKGLRSSADFVLLDTPPVSAVSDALVLAPESDAVILVADASKATRSQIETVRDQLEQVGANIIGGIFNNFDPSTAKYGYYYRGYYRYGYGSYGKYASGYHDEKFTAADNGKKSAESLEDSEHIWT